MIGSEDSERESRLAKNVGEVVFECLLEGELIPYVVILLVFSVGVYLVGSMVYHLMYDPNALDVASRLDALSIDPDKWMRRS